MLYGGSIAPGRWRGHDVTILDVFEAIGAHAAGEMSDEELRELEDVRQPRRRRLRRPVHRQHDGLRVRGDGDLAGGLGDGAGRGRREATTVAERIGELVDAGARRGPAPEPDHHPRVDRERDRLRLRVGRLDQRRPAPARGRPRGRDRARRSTTSSAISRAHAAARRPEARRPLRRHRPLPRRRRAADPQAPRRGRDPARATRSPSPAGRSARRPPRARGDPGPGGRAAARPTRSSREGGLAILRGNLAPEGCVVKLAGTERRGQTGPARVFESEEECFARGQGPGASSPATWS